MRRNNNGCATWGETFVRIMMVGAIFSSELVVLGRSNCIEANLKLLTPFPPCSATHLEAREVEGPSLEARFGWKDAQLFARQTAAMVRYPPLL